MRSFRDKHSYKDTRRRKAMLSRDNHCQAAQTAGISPLSALETGVRPRGVRSVVSPGTALLGWEVFSRPHIISPLCTCLQMSPLYKDTIQIEPGPTLVTSLYLDHLGKDPHVQTQSHSEVLGAGTPTYTLRGDAVQTLTTTTVFLTFFVLPTCLDRTSRAQIKELTY